MIRIVDGHSDLFKNTGLAHHHARQSIVGGTYNDRHSDALAGNKRKLTLLFLTTNTNSQEPTQHQVNILMRHP